MSQIRHCCRCQQIPRQDDTMPHYQYGDPDGPTTTACLCRQCAAQIKGFAAAAEPTYPPGSNKEFHVCGICRLACHDGDAGKPMRIAQADIDAVAAGAAASVASVKPGCYMSCQDCVDLFREAIRTRLARAHADEYAATPWKEPEKYDNPQPPELMAFGGNWLL